MNAVEIHLLTNHIPIFSSFFGMLIGLWGYITKNKGIMSTAMVILVLGGLSAIVANNSGEEAEELVEHLVGFDKHLIHEHEEAAEFAFLTAILVGVLAAVSWFSLLQGWARARILVAITCVTAIASFASMAKTAYEGGKIVHKELKELPSGGGNNNDVLLDD